MSRIGNMELSDQEKFLRLTEKQKAFAQFVCDGMTLKDAYLKAGYMPGHSPKDAKAQLHIRQGAYMLSKHPVISKYIAANRAVPVSALTVDSIIARMGMIMNGELQVPVFSKKGERYCLPPSFHDQVQAAKLLYEILKDREEKHPNAGTAEYELDSDLETKSRKFLVDTINVVEEQ